MSKAYQGDAFSLRYLQFIVSMYEVRDGPFERTT